MGYSIDILFLFPVITCAAEGKALHVYLIIKAFFLLSGSSISILLESVMDDPDHGRVSPSPSVVSDLDKSIGCGIKKKYICLGFEASVIASIVLLIIGCIVGLGAFGYHFIFVW